MRLSTLASVALGLASAACAPRPAPAQQAPASAPPQTAPPQTRRPLAGFAAQHVMVFPTRYLRTNPALGWNDQIGLDADFLKRVDDEITFALRERGLQRTWVFAGDVVKAAKRNASFTADPFALGEEMFRPPRSVPNPVPDPIAGDLRRLVALREDARYVLLPVEVRFEQAGSLGRAVLHLVMVDARLGQVILVSEVASEPALVYSNAIAASLAVHLADLIAAPPQ